MVYLSGAYDINLCFSRSGGHDLQTEKHFVPQCEKLISKLSIFPDSPESARLQLLNRKRLFLPVQALSFKFSAARPRSAHR